MVETAALLPLVRNFFEYDLASAVHVLEGMTEDEAAQVLRTLPVPLAVRVIKALQISYAAVLLRKADDDFLVEMTSHLDPQLATSILMPTAICSMAVARATA